MKKVLITGLVLMVSTTAMAQDVMDDGSKVLLPLEVQQCNLPTAPPPIPEVPIKEDLLKAQKLVKQFQTDLGDYRLCIDPGYADATTQEGRTCNPEYSQGNCAAIDNAINYSVDMEKRVAEMFNQAVRAYKASLAEK